MKLSLLLTLLVLTFNAQAEWRLISRVYDKESVQQADILDMLGKLEQSRTMGSIREVLQDYQAVSAQQAVFHKMYLQITLYKWNNTPQCQFEAGQAPVFERGNFRTELDFTYKNGEVSRISLGLPNQGAPVASPCQSSTIGKKQIRQQKRTLIRGL